MTDLEKAQIAVLDALVDLAELGGYTEKETMLRALVPLHSTIFSMKFHSASLYSSRTLKWLSEETGITWQHAIAGQIPVAQTGQSQ